MPGEKTSPTAHKYTNLFSAYGIELDHKNYVKILNCCISLDLIFSFSIFGYISLEPIAMTTVHIPVIIAGMLLGPLGGAATGLIFGLTSIWKASVSATAYGDIIFSPFKSGTPFQSLILSLGTRVLFGWIAGLLFMLLFKKADKKLYGIGAMAISVVSTMLHSFLVSLVMVLFFPKTNTGLLSSVSPSIRHFAVWIVTAAVLYVVYKLFSIKKYLAQYKEVIAYKRANKMQGSRVFIFIMIAFLFVSTAIVMHSFDRLSFIHITEPKKFSENDLSAVSIALQQLIALSGAIYIIAIVLLFVYDKGSIADSKLQEKTHEEAYQKKLKKALDVMQVLTKDYEIVMNTDITTNSIKLYKCSDEMSKIIDNQMLSMPFYDGGESFFNKVASAEDLPKLLELTTREKVLEYLKNDQMFMYVFKNKKNRYVETRIVPISDHEFVCGYSDVDDVIREKTKQQEKLEEAMRKAEAANEAKSAFLLNMSHDIRTPMNAIIGYTDILAKYRTDEENFNRCTSNIKASGQYLLDLINNVLEMARIESGVEELNEDPCDIRTILGNTYIVFKEDAEKKGISLSYDRNIKHDYLYVDKIKLQEMHLNIISNAVKYTNPGGSIKIFSTELPDEREGWCRIQTTTTDTGIGMSEDFVNHVFDDFAREENSTTSGIIGTGLGMGIVKKLVDMMNGSIEIDSKKGIGTTVRVTIPHRIADSSMVKSEDKGVDIDQSLFKGKRILLAEDNDLNAEIAEELLSDVGLLVDRAKDGIICVSMLETAPAGYYDVILMDVQMPNMDGYQATSIIRKLSDKQKAQTPIIAMTANAFAKDRKAALAAGMNEHISKPISIDKLVLTMSRFISK